LLLKDELKSSSITEAEQAAVLKYFDDNEEMLMEKDSTMSYIFKGINQGWLLEKAQKAAEVKKKSNEREEIWEGNEVEAKKFYEIYKPLEEGFKIVIDIFRLELSWEGTAMPLGFRDTQFRNKLSNMRRKSLLFLLIHEAFPQFLVHYT